MKTSKGIPIDMKSVTSQLACWTLFFGILIAAYASIIQPESKLSLEELIAKVGHHHK